MLGNPQTKIYLASEASLKDYRPLFDSRLPSQPLIQFNSYTRGVLEIISRASAELEFITAIVGTNKHGKGISLAPCQITQTSDSFLNITIVTGGMLADEAFRFILHWMLDTSKSGESEQIAETVSFTELIHCTAVNELLVVPMALKDQVNRHLAKIADDQVPIEDVKAVYAEFTADHPARSMVIESIGKAYLEERLRDENAYYKYSNENEQFKKDLQQYLHQVGVSDKGWFTQASVTALDEAQHGAIANLNDWNAENGCYSFVKDRSLSGMFCGGEVLKETGHTYTSTAIASFDGPADEWGATATASGSDWNQGAAEWQETPVPTGGVDDGWGNTGSGSADNNNGWGEDTGGTADAGGQDDNTCRRCKKPGHFARECPEPRDDNCFNCGQPGHMSRDCTEPKKPRGGDRACRKCNEVGHIARDCPNSGGGGEDRACHKCRETGHLARECPSSAFGAAAGGGGGGMKCYNCQQYGHKSSECTDEPVEREYGSDPRTCNKCGQKGHISRDCREEGGDAYYGGGGYSEQYSSGYGDSGYDGQGALYDPNAGTEESAAPLVQETINVTVAATRVRKGKKGRPGYVDITSQMYDPRAFEGPQYDTYGGGGERRGGGGSRGGRGGRGRGRGGRRDAGEGGHGGEFGNENVPPPEPEVPAVAVEGDWATAGDDSAQPVPAASGW